MNKILRKLPDSYDTNNQEFVKTTENVGYLKGIVRNNEIASYMNLFNMKNVGFYNFNSLVT